MNTKPGSPTATTARSLPLIERARWRRFRGIAYLSAVAAVAAAGALTAALQRWLGPSVSLFFFLAIVVPAIYGGYGPALVASVLSTLTIAYFFVPPVRQLDIGPDDLIRLSVFTAVAMTTAWLSSSRRIAEQARRRSLAELQQAVTTLQKVSRWPLHVSHDIGTGVHKVLDHAATIATARAAAVIWEVEDEPWRFLVATTSTALIKLPAGAATRGSAVPPEVVQALDDPAPVSVRFETDHVGGFAFFSGAHKANQTAIELLAHEVGNSLSQLYLADRLRQLAVSEDRIRVSRDLHDGILQALTGIRFELQSVAAENPSASDRLILAERALAKEQRELRLFIDELKPQYRTLQPSAPITARLDEIRGRFADEWRVPIALRVSPQNLVLPPALEQAVRLMVHEGVSNALRHGQPSRVAVDIERTSSMLTIVVSDDGRGFPFRGRLSHDELMRANAGPVSLRERVAALDGQLTVESRSTGSRVELSIPIAVHAV